MNRKAFYKLHNVLLMSFIKKFNAISFSKGNYVMNYMIV